MAGPQLSPEQEQRPQGDTAIDETTDINFSPGRPNRAIALYMSAYWLSWLLNVASDTLIAVCRQFFPGEMFIKSPIVRYIYTKHIYKWPHGGFYTLEPFFRRWNSTINYTFLVSSTVCGMLQLMLLGSLRPFKNDTSDALVMLWMAVCLVGGSLMGLTKHEVSVIALPYGWLSAKTIQLLCLRRGICPTDFNERRGGMLFVGSMMLFLAVYVRTLGVTSDMIVIVLLVEAGWIKWKRLCRQAAHDKDVEKGAKDIEI